MREGKRGREGERGKERGGEEERGGGEGGGREGGERGRGERGRGSGAAWKCAWRTCIREKVKWRLVRLLVVDKERAT